MQRPRRQRRPKILTELTSYRQPADRIRLKQDVCAKRNFFSLVETALRRFIASRKVSRLIKFRIGRNIFFRNKSKHFAVLQHCRHIVKFTILFQRKPHKHQRVAALCGVRHRAQRLFCLRQQQFL